MCKIALKRTGRDEFLFDGKFLARASCRTDATGGRGKVSLFKTSAGKYILAATLSGGTAPRDIALSFSCLDDITSFLSDPRNVFHPVSDEIRILTCDAERAVDALGRVAV